MTKDERNQNIFFCLYNFPKMGLSKPITQTNYQNVLFKPTNHRNKLSKWPKQTK